MDYWWLPDLSDPKLLVIAGPTIGDRRTFFAIVRPLFRSVKPRVCGAVYSYKASTKRYMFKQRGEWASGPPAGIYESVTNEPQERFETNPLGRKTISGRGMVRRAIAERSPPEAMARSRSAHGVRPTTRLGTAEIRHATRGRASPAFAATGRLFDTPEGPVGSTLPVASSYSSARDAARTTHARRRVVRGSGDPHRGQKPRQKSPRASPSRLASRCVRVRRPGGTRSICHRLRVGLCLSLGWPCGNRTPFDP